MTAAEGDGDDEEPIGETRWVIPGGHVPVDSTGPEPEMVSHDKLCVLNTGSEMATLEVTLSYADGHEAGPYPLTVAAERVRHMRINDLIDPYAPPLGRDYASWSNRTSPSSSSSVAKIPDRPKTRRCRRWAMASKGPQRTTERTAQSRPCRVRHFGRPISSTGSELSGE